MKFHAVDKDTIDIDRELPKIKKRLMQKCHKELFAFVDSAVTVGTAYILAQRKDEKDGIKGYDIISVDNTTF